MYVIQTTRQPVPPNRFISFEESISSCMIRVFEYYVPAVPYIRIAETAMPLEMKRSVIKISSCTSPCICFEYVTPGSVTESRRFPSRQIESSKLAAKMVLAKKPTTKGQRIIGVELMAVLRLFVRFEFASQINSRQTISFAIVGILRKKIESWANVVDRRHA